jgi:hypothetical protein
MLTILTRHCLKKIIITLWLASICLTKVALAIEAPEGVVFCHGKTNVEFTFDRSNANNDVLLTVNGKTEKFMSAYSWFGSNQATPKGFKYAILGGDQFDPLLVFDTYLIDAKQNKYVKCN